MERRKGLALILISLSIFTVASFPEIHPANAQTLTRVGSLAFNPSPETDLASAVVDTAGGFAYFGTRWGLVAKIRMSDFSRVGSLALNPGETNLQSAVIDPAAGFAYFGTGTSPGIVVKVRLSNFTRVSSLTLSSGENLLSSAVIDPAAGFAYFGTGTSPGIVVKISLSAFTRIGSLSLNSGENVLESALIDPAGGFAYFGTDTAPGIVVKVRLSTFTRFSALTLNSGEDALASAVIDPTSSLAYFGTDTSPGIVVKVGLSTFTRVANLTLNPAESFLTTAVIDPTPGFAYFGASGCLGPQFIQYCQTPGTLVKLRLTNFTRVGSLSFNSGEIDLVSSVIDSTGGTAYFGTDPFTNYRLPSELPGLVVKVDVSTFTNASAISMSPGETNASPSVIDSAAGFLYFGTYTWPGVIVKVRLSDFTRVGSLVLNPGEAFLGSAVIDPAAGLAYFAGILNPGSTNQGIVVKIRLSDFTRVGSLIMDSSERFLSSALIDSAAGFAYFGTSASLGSIVKIRLSNFTRVGALSLNGGESGLTGSFIDPAAEFAYFGTSASPGIIVKIRLSDFTRVGSLTLNRGDDNLGTAVVDSAGSYAYFGSAGGIVKVRLSDFTRVGAISVAAVGLGSLVIDSAAGFGYLVTGVNYQPSALVRIRLSDLARDQTFTLDPNDNPTGGAIIDSVAGFAYLGRDSGAIKLDIAAPPAFDFSMSSHGTIRVLQGDSGSTTVTTALSRGTPQSLSLYCVASTLPKDASCSFSPSSVTPNRFSVVTVTTTSATPTGSFQVQVTGSPLGTTTIPTVFTLTVNPSVLGLDPTLFYAIVGGIIAVTVIIALSAVLRWKGTSLVSLKRSQTRAGQ